MHPKERQCETNAIQAGAYSVGGFEKADAPSLVSKPGLSSFVEGRLTVLFEKNVLEVRNNSAPKWETYPTATNPLPSWPPLHPRTLSLSPPTPRHTPKNAVTLASGLRRMNSNLLTKLNSIFYPNPPRKE